MTERVLPTDPAERKKIPLYTGPLSYFPLAFAALSRHCLASNERHNPGEPLHWAREKSRDHLDCMARHMLDYDQISETGEYEAVAMLWRAAAIVQELEEKRLGKGLSRGSKVEPAFSLQQPSEPVDYSEPVRLPTLLSLKDLTQADVGKRFRVVKGIGLGDCAQPGDVLTVLNVTRGGLVLFKIPDGREQDYMSPDWRFERVLDEPEQLEFKF